MKVRIMFETVDDSGEVSQSQVNALMEIKNHMMILTYVEDLSGEGNKTRCTMQLSPSQLRVFRKGEVNSDFIYGNLMTHNTNYGTMYGDFPVTIQTEKYLYQASGIDLEDVEVEGNFSVQVWIHYNLLMGSDEPMKMKMTVKIEKAP